MAKKVTLEGLESAVKQILNSYENEVKSNLETITGEITKIGAQALRTESATMFGTAKKRKKKYAQNWTYTREKRRIYTAGIIYNREYQLPHLLENGHVSRNGTGRTFGFVPGREHIAKVEKELERLYEEEVKSKL